MGLESQLKALGDNAIRTRRVLLEETLFTLTGLAVAACSSSKSPAIKMMESGQEANLTTGDAEVGGKFFLPDGLANPASGVVLYEISAGYFKIHPAVHDERGKHPFRSAIYMQLVTPNAVSFRIDLGRLDEDKTRLHLTGRVDPGGLAQSHTFMVEWGNWEYRQSKWDDREIKLSNQTV